MQIGLDNITFLDSFKVELDILLCKAVLKVLCVNIFFMSTRYFIKLVALNSQAVKVKKNLCMIKKKRHGGEVNCLKISNWRHKDK